MPRKLKCKAKAITTGKRCSRWAIAGTDRCAQHTERTETPTATVTTLATRRKNKARVGKPGRPPLFGPSRSAAAIECLNRGATFRMTADTIGVSLGTLGAWMARGRRVQAEVEAADARGEDYTFAEGDEPYVRFFEQAATAMRAKSMIYLDDLHVIAHTAKNDSDRIRAITWYLERVDEQFVPLQRSIIDAQIGGNEGEPIKVIVASSWDNI